MMSERDQPIIEGGAIDPALRRNLVIAALVEGTTLLVLILVAVPLRYIGDFRLATQVVGPIHGLAFVAYITLLTEYGFSANRDIKAWVLLLLTAFLPFGAFITANRLHRTAERHQ